MVCIVVALARILPVGGPTGRLTEYEPASAETVNQHKHLGPGPVWPATGSGALPGRFRCRDAGWTCPAAGER